jgi:sulfite reductase (NADPH) hemoprotein beta-component
MSSMTHESSEVAFVGKVVGAYVMLNKYTEVTETEILAILKHMIKQYARLDGERLGDFVIRAGYISATTDGKAWYEGIGGDGPYR